MIYILISILIIVISVIAQLYLYRRHRRIDGHIIIVEQDGKKLFSLELDKNPDELAKMSFIVFKVENAKEDDFFAE